MNRDLGEVIAGFLRELPRFSPVLAAVTGYQPMVLKLELREPELMAEIDLSPTPLEVRFGGDALGTVGMTARAEHFHALLLGSLSLGAGINRKQLLVRGSTASLMKSTPIFELAPALYPYYLAAAGRDDFLRPDDRGELAPAGGKRARPTEGSMNFALSRLAYAGGYLLALAKSRFYPRLDVLAVVEAVGRGLERGRQSARPRGSAPG